MPEISSMMRTGAARFRPARPLHRGPCDRGGACRRGGPARHRRLLDRRLHAGRDGWVSRAAMAATSRSRFPEEVDQDRSGPNAENCEASVARSSTGPKNPSWPARWCCRSWSPPRPPGCSRSGRRPALHARRARDPRRRRRRVGLRLRGAGRAARCARSRLTGAAAQSSRKTRTSTSCMAPPSSRRNAASAQI